MDADADEGGNEEANAEAAADTLIVKFGAKFANMGSKSKIKKNTV